MRVLVTGAGGQVAAYAVASLRRAGHAVDAWSHHEAVLVEGLTARPVELTSEPEVLRALTDSPPEAILHLAAIASYEAVHREPEQAGRVNVGATATLAAWCRREGVRLLLTSTDAVFDGEQGRYREEDEARPVLAYGRTKRAAEERVIDVPGGLAARLSLLYGFSRCGRPGFFDQAMADLRAGRPRSFFVDEYRTPLHLADAADALAGLIAGEAAGIVHVGGPERLSRFELMRRAAGALGFNPALVGGNRRSDAPASEPRPADVSLDSSRVRGLLPAWRPRRVEEALTRGGR